MEIAVTYEAAVQITSAGWRAFYHINVPKHIMFLSSELKWLCYGIVL